MKLNRYFDFLLESVSKGEMRLYYSDEFRNILNRIRIKSGVAQALLLAEDSNQMLDIYTLIDVTEKNDTISLIQVSRIKRQFPDIDNKLPNDIHDKKMGSEFWSKARTEMKIGRWTKRIFTEVHKTELSDSKIEEFVNLYKSTFDDGDSLFEIVEGEDIRKWYLHSNYESTKGQLGASCMRHKQCQPYLDIYVKNPEVCKLLILKSKDDTDKISGRALVWKLNIPEEYKNLSSLYPGEYYMDRIYTSNDSDRILFENWALKNKMKHHGSAPSGLKWEMYIQLGDYEYKYYPYMDTFLVYNRNSKVLSNNEDLWPTAGFIKIQETGGGFVTDNVIWSNWIGEYISTDDAVWCEDIQDHLHRDDAIYLDYKDEWVGNQDNIVWSDFESEYFYNEDAVWSNCMNDYLRKDSSKIIELITSSNGDVDWCYSNRTDLYIELENKYYLRSNMFLDPYTKEYKFKEENDNADDVFDKIIEDILPGTKIENLNDFNKVRDEIIKQTIEIFNNTDLEEVIKEISNDYQFSKIRNVYWGLPKEAKVEAEDLPILLLYSNFINKDNRFEYTKLRDSYQLIEDESLRNKLEYKFKNWWGDIRIYRGIINLSKSFDFSKFGDEIYKRVLLFTL